MVTPVKENGEIGHRGAALPARSKIGAVRKGLYRLIPLNQP